MRAWLVKRFLWLNPREWQVCEVECNGIACNLDPAKHQRWHESLSGFRWFS